MKKAFTLAEVLITLGIIAVVAALTMPALISNYQKKQTAVQLKHFASLMSQAKNLRNNDIINGDFIALATLEPNSPDQMLNYFNIYWNPYLKVIKTEKLSKGIIAVLSNGNSIYLRKDYDIERDIEVCTYMIWCKNYKYCKALSESGAAADITDGKHSFVFVTWENIGVTPHDHKASDREDLINLCNNGTYHYCSSLIEYDGWEIKDDYPVW